ncbi:faeA-like family protein [Pluralibacter sp.]|uniref:faeA-like family protein n=1 Tax=Pluralibacter sp. TaxID=1920032 RepID=UPI0025DE691E|nr:faeA-like family protein [Pluralibacter sp.]
MKALYSLCQNVHPPPPDPILWPKTRQLADACNEDIYTARLLLLSLEKDGKVLCSHRSVQNSLRWYPVSPCDAEAEQR